MKTTLLVFTGLFLTAVLSRLVPHGWNFTLMGAVSIFAGAYFNDRKISVALMMVSMLVSDYFIGFHNQMPAVYLGFLAMIAVGVFLNVDSSRIKIFGYAFMASLVFFIVSNFGVWAEGRLYPQTFSGLIDCYVMGIPFFWKQMVGDMGFTLVLFELAKRGLRVPSQVKVRIK